MLLLNTSRHWNVVEDTSKKGKNIFLSRYWFRATCTKLSRSNKFRNCCKVISVHMNSPSQLSEYSTVDCNRLDMLDSLAIVVIPRKQFHLLIATNQSQEIPRSWKITRWTRYFENLTINIQSEYRFDINQIYLYPPTIMDIIVTITSKELWNH